MLYQSSCYLFSFSRVNARMHIQNTLTFTMPLFGLVCRDAKNGGKVSQQSAFFIFHWIFITKIMGLYMTAFVCSLFHHCLFRSLCYVEKQHKKYAHVCTPNLKLLSTMVLFESTTIALNNCNK